MLFFCMVFGVTTIALATMVLVILKRPLKRDPTAVFPVILDVLLTGFLLSMVIASVFAGITGGAGCRWKAGAIIGTVVDVEFEGQVYNTFETFIQVGFEGQHQAKHLSGYDMYPYLGQFVAVQYVSCWLPDWRRGNSHNYIVSVEIVEEHKDVAARHEI